MKFPFLDQFVTLTLLSLTLSITLLLLLQSSRDPKIATFRRKQVTSCRALP